MTEDLLARIDTYLDAVARAATRAEEIGPFTLFINEGGGWPYYARPSPGAASSTPADVLVVRDRQRVLGIPEAFEWVVDTAPGASAVIAGGGMLVTERPLMVAGAEAVAAEAADVRFAGPDDDLSTIMAVQHLGFAAPGTAVGEDGAEALARATAEVDDAFVRTAHERLAAGRTVTAAVWVDGHPVAAGSHQPVDGVSEVVGVATLPAYRRRGLAAALTSALVADARTRGVDVVFLSAGDGGIARVYERSGFSRVGTFADAAPPGA